jgi:hypothetical protein
MQTLVSNKDNILEIRKKVETLDSSLFTHYNIPNIPIYDDTISIVMTASNRSKQTYYTLKTIEKCSFKHVQLIIVDDSDIDPIKKEELEKYPFNIDLICIRIENKNWHNPVINYNIGFKYIRGSKVVIQNAEVCYIGDILGFISNNIHDNNYYSFDVKALLSFESNEIIYNTDQLSTDVYNKKIFSMWYQGRERICNYHFLTAMTMNTFELVKNFSYDYTFGIDYDDDDFLLKIKLKNINIVNLFSDIYNFGGIHMYHTSSYLKWKNIESNKNIIDHKIKKNKYIDIIDNIDNINLVNKKTIEYFITNTTNLLELQKEFLKLDNIKLHLIFDKKNFTNEMNTFYKCMKKGYFYKNSNIKLPKNINIKILYKNI